MYCDELKAIFDGDLPPRRSAIVQATNIARIAIAGPPRISSANANVFEGATSPRFGAILTVTISPTITASAMTASSGTLTSVW